MASMISKIEDAVGFAAAFKVSRETVERLNHYESLLKLWQPRINLIATATLDQVWHRHFADSAQLLPLLPAEAGFIADLGTGGGFPGLVLAIMLMDPAARAAAQGVAKGGARGAAHGGAEGLARGGVQQASGAGQDSFSTRDPVAVEGSHNPPLVKARVVLVESDQRKCAFLREVARQTGTTVEILSTRIENPKTQAKLAPVDVVTSRALAPLERLLELAAPLFGQDTVGLFMKGRGAPAEIDAARAQWLFDASLVPSVTAADASIVVVRRPCRRTA